MSAAPKNFIYHPDTQTLSWDRIIEAEEYEIRFKPVASPTWQIAYLGNETSCPFNHIPGTYNAEGKAKTRGEWGVYGPTEEVIIP